MKKRALTLLAIGALLCLAPVAVAGVPVGNPAPNFTLKDVNGVNHSLTDFEGRVVLLNFWQST
jgi:hypothetical protein